MTKAADSPDPAIARVGRAVTDRRLELGMATQRELADKAGVALNTAAFLERGHTFPRQGTQHKLEIALEWPRGTLRSMLRNEAGPPRTERTPPSRPEPVVQTDAPSARADISWSARPADVHVLAIASAVADIATTSVAILLRTSASEDPDTGPTLRELDAQLLALETVIVARLPHASGDAFDETMSALTDVHRQREALKDAARQRS
jgi:hypothetical protein